MILTWASGHEDHPSTQEGCQGPEVGVDGGREGGEGERVEQGQKGEGGRAGDSYRRRRIVSTKKTGQQHHMMRISTIPIHLD